MRKLLLSLLVIVSVVFAIEQGLIIATYEDEDAGTTYSSTIEFNDDLRDLGKFEGFWGLALDVDTLAWTDTTSNDTILFFPEYRIASNWITGDTIQWYQVGTEGTYTDSTTYVIPQTHYDWVMSWTADPSLTDNIQGYPYDYGRVKVVFVSDSNYFKINLRSNWY